MDVQTRFIEPCAHVLTYRNEQRLRLYRGVEAEIDRQLGDGATLAIVGGIIESGLLYFNDASRPKFRDGANVGVGADAYFRQRVMAQLSVLVTVAEKLNANT